jgi:septal ring factor EnvC (AmiA/AmiB activator)
VDRFSDQFIESFIKANHVKMYNEVIDAVERQGQNKPLVKLEVRPTRSHRSVLQRSTFQSSQDSGYCNQRLLRMTETLLELKEFKAAIEAARKAGTASAWKAVNRACVLNDEFAVGQ